MSPNDLIYIKKIPTALQRDFFIRLSAIAQVLQVNPQWLMQVFHAESGVDPARRNTFAPFHKKDGSIDGYATGFIQFTPDTARRLNTTTWDLEKMGPVKQLDYVYNYLKSYTGKIQNYFDLYLLVFFPGAVGHSGDDNYIFETKHISRSAVAKSNPAININKDGQITMAEFKQYVKNTVDKSLWGKVFDNVKDVVTKHPVAAGGSAAVLLIAVAAVLALSSAGGKK